MKRFTLKELEAMETLHSSHFDDLKHREGDMEVWISRMTVADGEAYNNRVFVIDYLHGLRVTIDEYEAK